jgi:kynurenine formamidase
MRTAITLGNDCYSVNTDFSFSLAIAVNFNTCEQPNHFGASNATAVAMQAGSFIGDTEQGGSCNVNELRINPHCNGTHTETIAHICNFSHALASKIVDICPPPLMPCVVISVAPEGAISSHDSYSPMLNDGDRVISRQLLEEQMSPYLDEQLQSVVVRTLPNSMTKCQAKYNEDNQPPFFSREAILYLNERGVEHLILDIPSLDRLHDDGLMTCHHLFWQVLEGAHQPSQTSLLNKTITEMAFVSDEVIDGFYFVNLQVPAFVNDAAPSRPILYQAQIATSVK